MDARADEFFAVFPSAADALRAAGEAQKALAAHGWPDGREVCMRIALHTGRPTLASGSYQGISVNTAARLRSAGHGPARYSSRARHTPRSARRTSNCGCLASTGCAASPSRWRSTRRCSPRIRTRTRRFAWIHELGRRPSLDDDLRVCRIHPIATASRVPRDQVSPRDATHDLVRAGHDAGKGSPGRLAVASLQAGVQDERLVAERQLGDLPEEAAAVRATNGAENLSQLPPTKVRLVFPSPGRQAVQTSAAGP